MNRVSRLSGLAAASVLGVAVGVEHAAADEFLLARDFGSLALFDAPAVPQSGSQDTTRILTQQIESLRRDMENAKLAIRQAQQLLDDDRYKLEEVRSLLKAEVELNKARVKDLDDRISKLQAQVDELELRILRYSEFLGLQGGGILEPTAIVPPHDRIRAITIVSRDWVNKVGFVSDGGVDQPPVVRTSQDADSSTFNLADGERLVRIDARYEGTHSIRQIRFGCLDKAGTLRWSPWYGRHAQGTVHTLGEDGREICGFEVSGAAVLNRIRIVSREVK
jgi:hypothetical protein